MACTTVRVATWGFSAHVVNLYTAQYYKSQVMNTLQRHPTNTEKRLAHPPFYPPVLSLSPYDTESISYTLQIRLPGSKLLPDLFTNNPQARHRRGINIILGKSNSSQSLGFSHRSALKTSDNSQSQHLHGRETSIR